MKKIILTSLLFSVNFVLAQTYNVPFRKGNLWGYADKLSKIIIEPKYDSVSTYSRDSRWFVYKNNKTGVIDIEGNEFIPVEYDSILMQVQSEYHKYKIYNNGNIGYTDINGKFLLPVAYKFIEEAYPLTINHLETNFFVKTDKDKNYRLINGNQNIILNDIEGFKSIFQGFYILQSNKKFGIYNMMTKSWKIPAEYDSIKYFDYKDYLPKEKFKNAYYYGIKAGMINLFTKNYEIVTTKLNKIEDFFYMPEEDNDDFDIPFNIFRKEILKVTGENYVENKEYISEYFNGTQLKILIIKEKEKYRIKINTLSFNESKMFLFDEICLINTLEDRYNLKYALVRNKDKWQFFNIPKNELLSNVYFDSYEIHKKFNDILVFITKDKIGLYNLKVYKDIEFSDIIEPIYDSFEYCKYIVPNDPIDLKNHSINLYYFKKEGKLCPVGINGIKFYQD